jgi:hypothetical protein
MSETCSVALLVTQHLLYCTTDGKCKRGFCFLVFSHLTCSRSITCCVVDYDQEEFRSELLPHLTRLFSIKDPPQNILILLDNLSIFQTKATPQVFREDVMPLIYVALESDMPSLQEKALKVIPGLCETLEVRCQLFVFSVYGVNDH